jgi:hypothetical protein
MPVRKSKSKSKTRSSTSARRTRKNVTVEGLHASFDRIASKVHTLIQKGSTDSDLACCIRDSWSEQFHTGLSNPAVKGMIMHYRAIYGSGKGSKGNRKTRKSQRGGMAPLDWTMGQGTTDHVYGRFPVEMGTSHQVVKALDRFTENRGGRACDTTGGHGPQMGGHKSRSQKGGGVYDAVMMGHAPHSVPRNVVETGVSSIQGAPIENPHSSPVSSTVHLAAFAPKPYDVNEITNISTLAHVYKAY